ncbi:flagellar basal body rod protein FlgB [Neobacillus thermocopriae]|uniref:flagellar basal body rod protein FlgB n=1 Tax=Neobacillus thermocopriae TaxID=1215031 RepID=UPI002E1C4D57|nr:flagellar basal body rod protein FlgB [Neobacillus thermocopriae]MED3623997.1 flagellar basal body rod protein FlgB [Neobacillus thermocopriae]MED3713808.1 flagellar basal body rod protein FlgB [Neobacillus thermocopriae]
MPNIGLLHAGLNAASLRQQAISQNIANAETSGYKAKKVVFEEILKKQLANQTKFVGNQTDPRHYTIGQPNHVPVAKIVENTETVMQNNQNNVDIDEEMTRMGKNSLWYYTLTEQINSEFQQLSIAIKGRV